MSSLDILLLEFARVGNRLSDDEEESDFKDDSDVFLRLRIETAFDNDEREENPFSEGFTSLFSSAIEFRLILGFGGSRVLKASPSVAFEPSIDSFGGTWVSSKS